MVCAYSGEGCETTKELALRLAGVYMEPYPVHTLEVVLCTSCAPNEPPSLP